MRSGVSLRRVALGAGAGLVGTLLMQGLRAGSQRALPGTMPRMRREPGKFLVQQGERALLPVGVRRGISEKAEAGAGQVLGVGYGMAFGAAYAAVRPGGGVTWVDGVVLGLATWAAGYLGWLPAAGVTEPVWREDPKATAAEALRHVMFGVGVVGAYDVGVRVVGG